MKGFTIILNIFLQFLNSSAGKTALSWKPNSVESDGRTKLPTIESIIKGNRSFYRPFYVRIVAGEGLGEEKKCGGTIISVNWIVTAASCVASHNAQAIWVHVGDFTGGDGHRELLTVSEVIVHESFNSLNHQHDIAMLRLMFPLSIEHRQHSFNLCSSNTATTANNICTLMGTCGLGTIMASQDIEPPNLREIFLTETRGGVIFQRCPQGVICTHRTSRVSQNICRGDEGGPLYLFHGDSTVPRCLYGVASYFGPDRRSRELCNGGSFFTSVPAHYYWILSKLHQ